MNNLEIQTLHKLKVKDQSVAAHYGGKIETDKGEMDVEISLVKGPPPNQKMIEALAALKPHLVVICDSPQEVSNYQEMEQELLDKYAVHGVRISGEDQTEGVIIMGKKRAINNKWFAINTPLVRYQDKDAYAYGGNLYDDVKALAKAFKAYLEGDTGVPEQQDIDFQEA